MRTCPQCRRRFAQGEAFCPYDGARLRDEPRDPTMAPDDADPLVGRQLDGRYQLQALLGKGGMGTVYAGRQVAIDKMVAIKVLREVDDDGQAMGRFEREAKSASRLGHPHIVDIFDFGRTAHPLGGPDAIAFLVMELLEGEDLGAVLTRERQLPLERLLPILFQCCSALAAAHAAGIVHRDLKPENLFLIADPATGAAEHVKIVDFGLAKITETEMEGEPGRKLTQTGMVFGTPYYMPPEQCTGRSTDARADIYSLGVIAFEALTGTPPFTGNSLMEVINQHLIDPPPPLREVNSTVHVPPTVEAVIRKALSKLAEDRQPTMRALSDELRAALVGTPWASMAAELTAAELIPDHRPATHSAQAFAATAPAQQVVDLDEAMRQAKARASASVALPTEAGVTAEAAIPLLQPRGGAKKKVIPQTRRAIDPVPEPEAPPAGAGRRSGGGSVPRSARPPQRELASRPAAPRFSSEAPPPPSGASRAIGWVLGGLLLLSVGAALGYLGLLLLR